MQSLQNQFVKAVTVHAAPYGKFITCIHSLYNFQNYLQCKTTDYCCQNFYENQSLTSRHVATWYNGERHYAVVY